MELRFQAVHDGKGVEHEALKVDAVDGVRVIEGAFRNVEDLVGVRFKASA